MRTTLFQRASAYAQTGQFTEMLVLCQQILDTQHDDVDALLDVGALLSNFGYLTRARECYARACDLASNDLRPRLSLANLAHNAANHAESRRLYSALQIALPNHPVIRRNALLSQEYDPDVPDAERFEHARGTIGDRPRLICDSFRSKQKDTHFVGPAPQRQLKYLRGIQAARGAFVKRAA